MRLQRTGEGMLRQTPGLSLGMAVTKEDVREVQRLRYQVFVEGLNLTALQNSTGLDQDEFDGYCDHLIVRDNSSLKIVGSYRILHPNGAMRLGKYYSEQEFDLSRLAHLAPVLCEVGRACIHPEYRGGRVLIMLFGGMIDYLRRNGYEYLMGCGSVSLADGGGNAVALYRTFHEQGLIAPPEFQVTPKVPFPLDKIAPGSPDIPTLLRGYIKNGAWIAGPPAWDPDFNCADYLTLFSLSRLDQRFASRYERT